jgi:hypothetical protein
MPYIHPPARLKKSIDRLRGEYLARVKSIVADTETSHLDLAVTNADNAFSTDQTITGQMESTTVSITTIKTGATQVAAGAAAGELWATASHATLPDNVVLIGV